MGIWWFAVGAVFGSAANALIDRLPRGESWMVGRPKCDKCKHVLGWQDLIPVVSFCVLGGRCRYCRKAIAFRNTAVELVMGGLWWATAASLGVTLESLVVMGMIWVSVVIGVMDWETKLVSEGMVAVWAVLVAVGLMADSGLAVSSGLGVLAGVGIIGGIWAISAGKAMGFGDVEIAAVMGWGLGWPGIIVGLWVAFVTGAVVGMWKVMRSAASMKSELAFGPFLIIGFWVAMVAGDMIYKWLFP